MDKVVKIIKSVLEQHLVEKTPSLYRHRWWTKELTLLKKAQNRLSNKSFRLCHELDHPIHADVTYQISGFNTWIIITILQGFST